MFYVGYFKIVFSWVRRLLQVFSCRAGINSGEEKKGEDIIQSTKKESENSEISMTSSRNPYLNGY